MDKKSGGASLCLPIQAPPVYRSPVGGAMSGSGVEASGWLDDIRNVVSTVGDVVRVGAPILGSLGI
ncbi:hypothetical protein ACI8AC_10085 [Geodermatophilus sp. SYSU D00758]